MTFGKKEVIILYRPMIPLFMLVFHRFQIFIFTTFASIPRTSRLHPFAFVRLRLLVPRRESGFNVLFLNRSSVSCSDLLGRAKRNLESMPFSLNSAGRLPNHRFLSPLPEGYLTPSRAACHLASTSFCQMDA